MRKATILAILVAAAVVASLATIPGALAGGRDPAAASGGFTALLPAKRAVSGVWGGGCVAVAANDNVEAGTIKIDLQQINAVLIVFHKQQRRLRGWRRRRAGLDGVRRSDRNGR